MTPQEKKRRKTARRGAWYRFKIDAYTPDTMPMARLAAYLGQLANILGEPKSVHLVGIEPGSLATVHRIEHEAIPKVVARVEAVKRGDAPRDARTAFGKVNEYLREDNASAVLRTGKTGPEILKFPGSDEADDILPSVKQAGSITGVLRRIGGAGDEIRVMLDSDGELIAGCHTDEPTAKRLARFLFEPVRLHGMGYWMRDAHGDWNLKHFRIDGFDELEDTTLSETLTALRAAVGDLGDDAYAELQAIRHGGSVNGGD